MVKLEAERESSLKQAKNASSVRDGPASLSSLLFSSTSHLSLLSSPRVSWTTARRSLESLPARYWSSTTFSLALPTLSLFLLQETGGSQVKALEQDVENLKRTNEELKKKNETSSKDFENLSKEHAALVVDSLFFFFFFFFFHSLPRVSLFLIPSSSTQAKYEKISGSESKKDK